MVARHTRCARHLADIVSREPGIRVLNEVVINQAVLAFGTADEVALESAPLASSPPYPNDGIRFSPGGNGSVHGNRVATLDRQLDHDRRRGLWSMASIMLAK